MFTAPDRPFKVKAALCPEPGELARCAEWLVPANTGGGHALSKIGSQACKFHFHQLLARPGEFYCGNPTSQQHPPHEQLQFI